MRFTFRGAIAALAAVILAVATPAAAEPLRLAAAGSLRAALSEVAAGFAAGTGGMPVTETYGPSGLPSPAAP